MSVFDAKGHPYRRRDDDVTTDVRRGVEWWTKLMLLHRGKLFALATGLGGFITWSATTIGLHYVGPKQEVQALDKKVDTLAARVSRVEHSVADGAADRTEIKNTLSWMVYMECRQQRRADPTDVPPICDLPRRP